MKKWMIFPVLLLFLLTACQPVPDSESEPTGSTPSSSSITPPSSSAVPATSIPAVDVHDGRAFVTYGEPNVELGPDWVPPSDCLVDHLYWVIKSTKECILICDEPIFSRSYTTTDTHVYFVKESEPTKIYRTPIGDFANHQLFYESTFGKVNYMDIVYRLEGYCNLWQTKRNLFCWIWLPRKVLFLWNSTTLNSHISKPYHIRRILSLGNG